VSWAVVTASPLSFNLNVTIPVGSTAVVFVPDGITVGAAVLPRDSGACFNGFDPAIAEVAERVWVFGGCFFVGSGTYSWSLGMQR
jgi:hypothetical protein